MSIVKYEEAKVIQVNPDTTRRMIYTDHLLTAIVEFRNGPATEPDPFHSHPHEQTCYIAEGEVLFFIGDDEPVHVKAGDLVAIPGHIPHTTQLLTPYARLIDTFNPVREDFL